MPRPEPVVDFLESLSMGVIVLLFVLTLISLATSLMNGGLQ